MTERTGRRRAGREAGGREGRREARANATVKAMPFIERKIPFVDYLSDESLQLIEDNADTIFADRKVKERQTSKNIQNLKTYKV